MPFYEAKRTVKKILRNTGNAIVTGAKIGATARYANAAGMSTLAKDVMMIKKLMNVEKKRYTQNSNALLQAGQMNGAVNSGHYTLEITPLVTSGSGYSQRTGSSIKLLSTDIQFQFTGMSAQATPLKIRVLIVQNKGSTISITNGQNVADVAPLLLEANRWVFATDSTNVYDYNSPRAIDKMGNWKILRDYRTSIMGDQVASQTNIKEFRIGLKYKENHIKFDFDSAVCDRGQMALVVLVDAGNTSSVNASTPTSVPITAINTGLFFRYALKHFYVDN